MLVLRKRTVNLNQLYSMTRHFVWLIPLTNLIIFLALGVLMSLPFLWRGGRGRWVAVRLFCGLTLLPPVWVALPRIYGPASLLLVMGAATQLVPVLELYAIGFRRLLRFSFPAVAGLVTILASSLWAGDRIKEWREGARPLPPRNLQNVLMIILDTVGAEHLSLYGYKRPTCPTIEELAPRGIRFDRAQATSTWTLPSHASMFTGRWPHELSTGWLTPLDDTAPTLAEYLGSRGYATAGFAANYWYCASDSGLGRGFVTYQDYIFPRLTALKTAVLVKGFLDGLRSVDRFLDDWLDLDFVRPAVGVLSWLFEADQKTAAVVNGEFLEWLARAGNPNGRSSPS